MEAMIMADAALQQRMDREMHVVAAIEEWNRCLPPQALLEKYAKIGRSPLDFYRGTNHLFWADFSGDERLSKFGNELTITWITGDCHAENFSSSGSDAEGPMYGLNDVDEAVIADYQYDVWRLAISIVLIGFVNGNECATEAAQKAAVQGFAKRYLRTVVGYRSDEMALAKGRLSTLLSYTAGNIKGRLVRFLAIVEREYSRRKLLKKWCFEDGQKYEFLQLPDKLQRCPKYEADAVASAFGYYAETAQGTAVKLDGVNVKDIVRRLYAGHGSCGLPEYYVLTEASDGELHILDVKLQQKPTPYHFMRPDERKLYRERFQNDAMRHSEARKILSSSQDPFNGWIELKDDVHPSAAGFYSVRDLSPYDESFPSQAAEEVKPKFKGLTLSNQEALIELAEDWARILGMQHAHAACVIDPEGVVDNRPRLAREMVQLIKVDRGGFEDIVWNIAKTYAEQVHSDWMAFKKHLLP